MPTRITHVSPGSIADRLGLRIGDQLVSIAGEPVIDQIDYQALTAGETFDLELSRGGEPLLVRVRKADWEPLGITLDQDVMARPRPCANRCVFCFIDQMPPGMRETLYVKDDDWRLSLMMGNYITMTNMTDAEFDRVLRRRVSPLYISVHATDPEVRVRMLKNPRAAQLMPRLQKLKENGIRFHCQIVLCPGWNDGDVLLRTLEDLAALRPAACSAALVPVGLTRFREGLEPLKGYDRESAAALLDLVEPFRLESLRRYGTRFAFPSDEMYCLAGRPLPPDEAYEDYPQIENGVGMLRMFETDRRFAAEDEPVAETKPRNLRLRDLGGSDHAGLVRRTGPQGNEGHRQTDSQPLFRGEHHGHRPDHRRRPGGPDPGHRGGRSAHRPEHAPGGGRPVPRRHDPGGGPGGAPVPPAGGGKLRRGPLAGRQRTGRMVNPWQTL